MSSNEIAAKLDGLDPAGMARLGAAVVAAMGAAGDGFGLLALVREAVGQLRGQALGGAVDDAALRDSVVALQRVETMAHAEKLRRVAAVDDRKAYLGRAMSTAA